MAVLGANICRHNKWKPPFLASNWFTSPLSPCAYHGRQGCPTLVIKSDFLITNMPIFFIIYIFLIQKRKLYIQSPVHRDIPQNIRRHRQPILLLS